MTRDQIIAGLDALVLAIANDTPPPPEWTPHEWAYVKGLASGALMRLRERMIEVARL